LFFLRHSIVKHLRPRPLIVLSLAFIVVARQVFELSTSGHVTASFLELQWLPVCTYYGVSSSNCAALCTQFSMADVQLIWPPLCSRLMPSDHTWVNVWGQCRWLTYRSYVPSLESVLSRMPVSLHGTQCRNTSVLNLTFVFLGNSRIHVLLT